MFFVLLTFQTPVPILEMWKENTHCIFAGYVKQPVFWVVMGEHVFVFQHCNFDRAEYLAHGTFIFLFLDKIHIKWKFSFSESKEIYYSEKYKVVNVFALEPLAPQNKLIRK